MFPVSFAFDVIAKNTRPGDAVIDPFAGRASSIYAAVAQGRTGYGMEIHPVGWLYGRAKLAPAARSWVLNRVDQIARLALEVTDEEVEALPEFYHVCYCDPVLRFLLAAREHLRWETRGVDATLMALILVVLHGKLGQCLSNQMRQGKAMDPAYSVRWWREREMLPPQIEPRAFLRARIEWRYAKGVPALARGHIEWSDSTTALRRVAGLRRAYNFNPFRLLFTSPPYLGVTNYFYDQWLRMWMLRGPAVPTATGEQWQSKFESKAEYRLLLEKVFTGCAEAMNRNAVVYVRTDARQFTRETTLEVLHAAFPRKQVQIVNRPYEKATQTALYGDKTTKPGEIDIIMR